jgi:hypothetical protein
MCRPWSALMSFSEKEKKGSGDPNDLVVGFLSCMFINNYIIIIVH